MQCAWGLILWMVSIASWLDCVPPNGCIGWSPPLAHRRFADGTLTSVVQWLASCSLWLGTSTCPHTGPPTQDRHDKEFVRVTPYTNCWNASGMNAPQCHMYSMQPYVILPVLGSCELYALRDVATGLLQAAFKPCGLRLAPLKPARREPVTCTMCFATYGSPSIDVRGNAILHYS